MGKLFAMEELDAEIEAVELAVTPEEGEVADVQVEVEQEVAEVAEGGEAIEEGMEAADQLEQVEEVVEQAVEEGEGLDPVAAEAIKLAVEAICARVGANPKAVYALYATENFQSTSSRKANTKIALEGVGEFLKDMWKKIKAALQRLWAKAKEFFDKHFSSLGRVKSALESMKAKVAASSGKAEKAYVEEAPASMAEAFAGKTDVTVASVKGYIAAHTAASKAVEELTSAGAEAAKLAADAVKQGKFDASKLVTGSFDLGTAKAPLVGGLYLQYTITAEEEDVSVEVERQTIEAETKVGVNIPEKAKLTEVINEALALINADVKEKAAFEKKEAEFNKQMVAVEKAINDTVVDKESAEAAKEARKQLKVVYKSNAKVPGITAEKVALDVKLAKAVIGFCGFCVKQYK